MFVVGDTWGVKDCWDVAHAYKNALQYGSTWVNDCGISWNPGDARGRYAPGSPLDPLTTDGLMHHEPVTGMSGGPTLVNGVAGNGFPYITQANSGAYGAKFGGEINSQHDSYALAMDFRFISELEFKASQPSGGGASASYSNGSGARLQRITVYLNERSNPATINTQILTDIFFDLDFYRLNFPFTPPFDPSYQINCLDGEFDQSGALNSVLFIGKIADNLRKKLASCAASLHISYELPRSPNGALWPFVASHAYYSSACGAVENPNSGVSYDSWGVLSATFTCFRSDTYTTPTTSSTGSNWRLQNSFPIVSDEVMGQNLDATFFTNLVNMGNAAEQVSWPSVFQGMRNFGGLKRVVCGDSSWLFPSLTTFVVRNTANQYVEFNIQIPNGATKFTLHTLVDLIPSTWGIGPHSLKFELTRQFNASPFVATQTLHSFSGYGGNEAWVWVDGVLDPNLRPINGNVEWATLRIMATKSGAAGISHACANGYSDGVKTVYLAFRP